MSLRLRQIALVAEKLSPAERSIAELFGLAVCFRDPAVAEYGLENALFPIGNQFLEIVAPTRAGTAAGRFLARRGGDGGYMVITQCDNHAERRARVAALGVRIAHQFIAEDFLNMQLHPRDTGGSFFEIDEQLGEGAADADGAWRPAGPGWSEFVRTERVTAIAAAELQVDDPQAVAQRWSDIAEIPLREQDGNPLLQLDNASLRFVACRDGRPEGLAGLDLVTANRKQIITQASALGLAVENDCFVACGMRWKLL
jgi:hypothetical protein